jgi:hypothetical protein
MERMRQAVMGEHQQGRGLPKLEEERMRQAGGAMAGRETGREAGREGGREVRAGELPGLETREGWERKEGYGERGYGQGQGYDKRGYGEQGQRYGEQGYGYGGEEGWAGEEETGVPAATRGGREKVPADMTSFWDDWKFGLTYNADEWGCVSQSCFCLLCPGIAPSPVGGGPSS